MPPSKSLVWDFYSVSENKLQATCLFCKGVVNTKDGNTSSMRKHLSKHATEYEKLLKAEQDRAKVKAQTERRPRSNSTPAEGSCSQANVKDLFMKKEKVSLSSKEQRRFDEAMVDQLCCTATPYNWCDHPKTRKLFDIANPTLTVKTGVTYSRQTADRSKIVSQMMHDIISAEATRELYSASFTTDNWTARNNDQFMSLSMHYISHDWDLRCWCLRVSPCHGRHTAVNLRFKLSEMIEGINIPEKTRKYVVNDNAANIVLAVEGLDGVEECSCGCHTLQLAIQDTFNAVTGKHLNNKFIILIILSFVILL